MQYTKLGWILNIHGLALGRLLMVSLQVMQGGRCYKPHIGRVREEGAAQLSRWS